MQEQINNASGTARAIELEAEARRKALEKVTEALNKSGGHNAAALMIAEKYSTVHNILFYICRCIILDT